jgi:hypothetical protein
VSKGSNARSDWFTQTPASEYFARTSRVLFFFLTQHNKYTEPWNVVEGTTFSISAGLCCCASVCGTRLSRVSHGARNDWTRPAPSRDTCVLRALFILGHVAFLACTTRWVSSPITKGGGALHGRRKSFNMFCHLQSRYDTAFTKQTPDYVELHKQRASSGVLGSPLWPTLPQVVGSLLQELVASAPKNEGRSKPGSTAHQ